MISHEAVRRLISARLDAPLAPAEADALAAHLAGCPACRAYEQRLVAGLTGVAALPRVASSPGAARAIAERAQMRRRAGWLDAGMKLAGALAAFALIGALLVAVLRPHDAAAPAAPAAAASPTTATATAVATANRLTPTSAPATPSAVAVGPGPCPNAPVALRATVGGAAGTMGISVSASRDASSANCDLATTVTLTITGADGQPLDIQGNRAMAQLDLARGQTEAGVVFGWTNLCGVSGPVRLVITAPHAAAIAPLFDGPGCNGPGQPSNLRLMAGVTPDDPGPIIPGGPEPDCAAGDFGLSLTVEPSDTRSRVVLGAWPLGGACLLNAAPALTITGPNSAIAGATADRANPSVAADLNRRAPVPLLTAIWTQPCPSDGDGRIAAELSGLTATVTEANPPCDPAATDEALDVAAPSATPTATQTTAPTATATLAPCGPNDYTLSTEPTGAMGRIVLFVGAQPTGAPCRLISDVTLTIEDANGQPLDIQGNGAVGRIDADLTDGAGAGVAFIWSNWCGDRTGIQWRATADGQETTQPAEGIARCGTPEQPSTLELLPTPDVTPTPYPTPTATPSCGPGDWPPSGNGQRDFAGPGLAVESYAAGDAVKLEVTAVGAPRCQLMADMTLTLSDATGQPLPGLPDGVNLSLQGIAPGQYARVVATWSNWCGDIGADAYQARVTLLGKTLVARLAAPPPCDAPGQATTLTAADPETLDGPAFAWADRAYAADPTPTATPPSTLPACGPAAFQLAMRSGGGTPGTFIGVVARNVDPNGPCRLSGDVALRLEDGDARPLDVQGNPISAPLDADLTDPAGRPGAVAFSWSEWCGDRANIQWEATIGSRRLTLTAQYSPRCDGPGIPSRLYLPRPGTDQLTPTVTP